MSGIGPISGSTSPIQPTQAQGIAARKQPQARSDFQQTLRDYVDKVDQDQSQATSAVRDLVTGENQDVLSVVTSVADADLSFKLLLGVRNKVIEAYKQTMNMQI